MSQEKLPDLSRTRDAIRLYDFHEDSWMDSFSIDQAIRWMNHLERLGEAVGVAFGMDTGDRNSLATCRQCIRPGPRIPGPGYQLSFVRRMVKLSEGRNG